MNQAEFRNEYLRLANGFNREQRITDERLISMFGFLSHHELRDVQAGIDRCLCDDSMPSFARLQGSILAASDARRDAWVKTDRSKAAGAICGVSVGIHAAHPADRPGLQRYREICNAAWASGLSPRDTAIQVTQAARSYPFLAEEVHQLLAMGDHWPNAAGHFQACDAARRSTSPEDVHATEQS